MPMKMMTITTEETLALQTEMVAIKEEEMTTITIVRVARETHTIENQFLINQPQFASFQANNNLTSSIKIKNLKGFCFN